MIFCLATWKKNDNQTDPTMFQFYHNIDKERVLYEDHGIWKITCYSLMKLRLLLHEVKDLCENNDDGCWRTYIRIFVRLDARIPIMKDLKLKKQGGEWLVMHFRYARIPILSDKC